MATVFGSSAECMPISASTSVRKDVFAIWRIFAKS
jgi:hypothetical protein